MNRREGIELDSVDIGQNRQTGRQLVEVGPDNLEWVRLDDIQLLKQVRHDYNQQDIETLAYSIIKDSDELIAAQTPNDISNALRLMHPLTVNRMTCDNVGEYLQKHADFYELGTPEIVPQPDGPTIVTISGHRRYLALEYIIVKIKGLTTADVQVLSQVYHDLPFEESLALQLRENVKTNPPPQDEAKSIERYYRYVIETTGVVPTYREIANHIGFEPAKVQNALAFMSLPSEVRDYVSNPRVKKGRGDKHENEKIAAAHIPYSTLVRFKPYMEAVAKKYDLVHGADEGYSGEARDKEVVMKLKILAKNISGYILENRGATYVDAYLTGKIQAAQGELLFEQDELLQVGEAAETVRRNSKASDLLVEKCLMRLQLLAEHGEMSSRYSDALKSVFALLDEQAATQGTVQDQA